MSQQQISIGSFTAMLEQSWRHNLFVCIGLDPQLELIPPALRNAHCVEDALFLFNREIIDATHDLVSAYKPNAAFYEAHGDAGLRALSRTVRHLKMAYPYIPVILDAKRADISSTNIGYVRAAFDELGADAITVHPYLGREALAPFLERKEKGVVVLVRTSNPGAGEFQDLLIGETREPLYQVVARHVAQHWNSNNNCSLVVGATYPGELQKVRAIVGNMPILIPGIGAQGGDVAATVKAGRDSRGQGMIISSSRAIIFAGQGSDFAQAARVAISQLNAKIRQELL